MWTFNRTAVHLAALLFASNPWTARAEPPVAAAPATSLTSAVDAAWRRAVSAAEADAGALRADASRAVANGWFAAAPSLEVSRQDGRWAPGSATERETEIAAALPLWLPGQRAARWAVAHAEADLVAAQRLHARWQLAGQVREAGWAVVSAHAESKQLQASKEGLQRVADDVARRVQAGDLARVDSLAARAEGLAAEATAADARLRLADAERSWSVLTGTAPPTSGDLMEPPAPAPLHPELPLAERTVEQARRELDAVQSVRRDPPELLVRYRQEADSGTATRNSVGIGLRIPLGGEARNRPLDAQASGALAIAERRLDLVRTRLATDLAQAQAALQVAQSRLQSDTARNALANERMALVRKAFDAGDTGLPELLRVMADTTAAQTNLDRSHAALGLARARLAQAQGITP